MKKVFEKIIKRHNPGEFSANIAFADCEYIGVDGVDETICSKIDGTKTLEICKKIDDNLFKIEIFEM